MERENKVAKFNTNRRFIV